jgi:ABC-type transport system involved in cytochrome bd biosynthesis fused ATPase/permease subunit
VAPEIFIPLRRAGAEFHASTEGQAAATRVLEVLALATPVVPIATTSPREGATPSGAPDLCVEGLRVEYANRSTPALDGFSLHAGPGSRVALVGRSGSGKSSVLATLLGFVPHSAGTLSINGRSASEFTMAQRRAQFAWLPQRPYLFNTTLAENLRLGAPDATDDALERVSGAVGLDRLVAHLPAGLETPLGQDGLTLSAGERQRVALARALLCPAPVLLLDEPTASLDPATANRIADAIAPWLSGRTVIVAAHQPLLLPRFDAIVDLASASLTTVTP